MLAKLFNRLVQPEQETEPQALEALAAAALLLEVAWADHTISDEELALIEEHLQRQFGMTEAEVEELVTDARRAHEESVGLYSYTRTINEAWTEAQKFSLVTALWRLAMASDDLHRYEEHTIRKIAELLYLSHERFIEAKLRVKRGV